MVFGRKRSVSDEASELGEELVAFLTTLAGVVRNGAEWLRIVGRDAFSYGADMASDRAGSFAQSSRAGAKQVTKSSRNALLQMVLFAVFIWWLDRELSEPSEQ